MAIENESGAGSTETVPAVDTTPALDSAGSSGDESFALSDNILGEDLDEQIPVGEPEAKTQQVTETKPAVVEAKPSAPVTETKPAALAPQEAPKGEQSPQVGQRPTDLSSMPPDALVNELSRNREALLDNIANTRFALTQQEKDALETDAVAAIPKLLARVYFEAATTALNQIASHVPRMVEGVTAGLTRVNNVENAFYSKFPAISRTDENHGNVVRVAANAFRQSNPTATPEQAIEMVGKMAIAMLGLQAPVSATNANGNGGKRPPAFTPAGGSARAVSSTQVAKPAANPFDGLGSYFDES